MSGPGPKRWARVLGDVRAGEGPTLVCVGGIHGNEFAGVRGASAVAAALAGLPAGAFRGRFLALSGHLGALNSGDETLRYFEQDLNRLFSPGAIEAARGRAEDERSPDERELLEIVRILTDAAADSRGRCVLLDLHTVSSRSAAFACVEDSLPARRLGMALGLPLVLGFEEELEGLLVDYATNSLGMISLVVEAGVHDDPESVRVAEGAVWVVLERLGMVRDASALAGDDPRARLARAAGAHAGRVFDVRARERLGEPPMELLGRAQAFARVWQGITPVAERCAGGTRQVVRAPADGLLFMPNRQKRRRPGDDAFFVLRPVWRRFMGISAWLRGRAWAHRLLAALPGVSAVAGEPHALRVDHDIAALMARDVFHLFGYRVHAPHSSPYRRIPVRMVAALWVLPLALLRAAGLVSRTRDEIWIVRRRRLDLAEVPPAGPGRG